MGAAAEVDEGVVAVQGDRLDPLLPDQVLDQLDLVGLALGSEALDCLRRGELAALEALVRLDVGSHPLLDPLQIGVGGSEAVGEVKVVVEAVRDRWADRDLGSRPEVEHRGRHDVGRVVADQPQSVLVAAWGEDLDRGPVAERRRRGPGAGRPP